MKFLDGVVEKAVSTFGSEHPDAVIAQINHHLIQQAHGEKTSDAAFEVLLQRLAGKLGEAHPSVKRARKRIPATFTIDLHPF